MSTLPPGSQDNPYGAPAAPVSDTVGTAAGVVERGRVLSPLRGFGWYGEAWRLFTVSPWAWIGIWLLFFLCVAVLSIVPLLGFIANALAGPIFIGGVMLAARSAERSGVVPVGQLFAAFGSHAGPLALLGILQLVAWIVIMIIGGLAGATLVFSTIGIAGSTAPTGPADLFSRTWLPLLGMGLLVAIIYLPVAYATWFAAALVTQNDVPAVDALRMGFVGTFRNVLPLLVFLLCAAVLAVLASLPLLLGWFVLGPLFLCALYVQYREIFAAAS